MAEGVAARRSPLFLVRLPAFSPATRLTINQLMHTQAVAQIPSASCGQVCYGDTANLRGGARVADASRVLISEQCDRGK